MGVRVPHRLGLAALVPLALRAPPGGDGVNDLPVSEGVPVPVEVGLQVAWGRVVRAPTMNRSLASSRAVRLAAESMPASATMMRSSMPWAAWKASAMGMIVVVSALFPSQQPTWRGKP